LHVTGIFYSGFDEYDRRLMYTALRDTQELVGRGDQVMGVEMKVKDVDRAEAIAKKLQVPPRQAASHRRSNTPRLHLPAVGQAQQPVRFRLVPAGPGPNGARASYVASYVADS
jgi:hypothetical protein